MIDYRVNYKRIGVRQDTFCSHVKNTCMTASFH